MVVCAVCVKNYRMIEVGLEYKNCCCKEYDAVICIFDVLHVHKHSHTHVIFDAWIYVFPSAYSQIDSLKLENCQGIFIRQVLGTHNIKLVWICKWRGFFPLIPITWSFQVTCFGWTICWVFLPLYNISIRFGWTTKPNLTLWFFLHLSLQHSFHRRPQYFTFLKWTLHRTYWCNQHGILQRKNP